MNHQPTPRNAAPNDVRRAELVEEVLTGLERLDELPLEQQTAALSEAQAVLQAVLNNDPGIAQMGIPGVSR